MSAYKPTIGLEIHVELKTRTKMFCDSLNDPDERHPNQNVCPVCLGHPGTLPVINKKAVEHVVRVGLALGGNIAGRTKFDRKNYFYPDLPKNYQISQYDQPLVSGGSLNDARITRVHLEEDAGRLSHGDKHTDKTGLNTDLRGQEQSVSGEPSHSSEQQASLVDFNRAGVPLMELVTEPDIESADEAVAFAKELQLLVRYLGVSDADMEKGQMRVEANVSVRPATSDMEHGKLGVKVEVKNINSFKAVRDAIEYEIRRQEEILEKGEKVRQETRGWDDVKRKTVSQRSKEEAHDYRYFPEPDLPPFETGIFDLARLKEELPELPAVKRVRFAAEYNLSEKQANLLITDPALAEFFEESISELKIYNLQPTTYNLLFNYLTSDLAGLLNEAAIALGECKISAHEFAHLVALIEQEKITSRQAKDLLKMMFESGEDPETLMQKSGMENVADENRLAEVVQNVIAENPAAVTDYKKGKSNALQFLIGKAMGKLRGGADPNVLRKMLEEKLR